MTLRIGTECVMAGALVSLVGTPVFADFFGFDQSCTNNDAGDVAIGFDQLLVEVTDAGGGLVDFTFTNSGPEASSITDVYFDDGSLLDLDSIINVSGVLFSEGADPSDLPGGNNCSPPFEVSVGFSADSDPPIESNGVNPGDVLTIRFSLLGGQTFADVLDELGDGTLRVGIHVQGFDSGGSEAFVNEIPAPGTVAFVATAGALGCRRRRRT